MRLTADHAGKLYAAIHPKLGYLSRLLERMERVGFAPDDDLLLKVKRAYDAMHSLSVELHYRSVDGGTGRSGSGK